MTKDDIIKLAREAGLFHFYDSEGHCDGITDVRLITEEKERDDDRLVEMIAPFAALVAAAERDALLRQIRHWGLTNLDTDLVAYIDAIRARTTT